MRERMQGTRTPGLAYAVVGPDGPVHARSWGTDGNGEPVTASTPFLWGSVAKPITASAVITLVQDGRLRLDDLAVDHLQAFRFGGPDHATASSTTAPSWTSVSARPASAPREGTAPEPPSATMYYATVWGLTALALVLLAEALHSFRLLRRGGSRRLAPTVLWCLAGGAPSAALVAALGRVGSGALWTWTPDAFTVVCVASAAGAAVIALRLGAAMRAGRGGTGRRALSMRGSTERRRALRR
ncbi:serine hydrolase [Streptomyces sp. R44]|uniref:Serine hydrolase n=1 Tax=Streptomyces sp. R44 TaxID=3238633 RepID=A0AB39SRY3_9ACTN